MCLCVRLCLLFCLCAAIKILSQPTMCSPIYDFCMVPHGSPFRDAAADDWIALGKSSESRLIDDDNAALYIKPLGMGSRALKYIKIGVEHGMARYAHSLAMYEEYDDMVLRMVPSQNAVVRVDVLHCLATRSRKLECRFQGSNVVFHSHTYPLRESVRAFRLQDILLTALRSRNQASCNTQIVLVRVGPETVISPAAFLWEPGEIRVSSGRWSASRSPQRSRKRKRTDHFFD